MWKVNCGSSRSIDRKHQRFFYRFVDLAVALTLSGTMTLHASCLRLLPDKYMVTMIMELVQNQNFIFTTSNSKQIRICCLKNGILRDQFWLFSSPIGMPTSALPRFQKKFTNPDNLGLLHCSKRPLRRL